MRKTKLGDGILTIKAEIEDNLTAVCKQCKDVHKHTKELNVGSVILLDQTYSKENGTTEAI